MLQPPTPPTSSDPKDWREYLGSVSRYHFVVSLAVLSLLIGALWAMSPMGFARAGNIDERINAALVPIKAKQEEVEGVIHRIDDLQKRDSLRLAVSLGNSVSADIRLIVAKRCQERDPGERERLWREIEKRQDEYKIYREQSYPLPSCAEL
jgi:hypothetical protein